MKIYSRYIFKSFLGLFILCCFSAVLIFVVVDFVGNSKEWLARPHREIYLYYMYYLPHILYLILPIALLLAAVFSVGNLAKHLELVALKAAGLSVFTILLPILFFGILCSAGMFYVENRILPDANHKRFKINEPKSQDSDNAESNEKFNYIYTGSDGFQYYFEYFSGNKKMGQGITILKHHHGLLFERYDARSMYWEGHNWKLTDGIHRTFNDKGLQAESFKEVTLLDFKDQPKDLMDERVYPDEMSLQEIHRRISILSRTGESTRALETQGHFRFASALVNFFMVLIGCALAVNTIKTGLARNFGFALLITFLYYIALRVGLVMGENGALTPLAGAWFGNALFAPLGLFFLWKAART